MDNKIVGIVLDHQADVSMLAWSIYYLSGSQKYYYSGFDFWFEVLDNPINADTNELEVEVDGSSDPLEFRTVIDSIRSTSGGVGTRLVCTRVRGNNEISTDLIDTIFTELDKTVVVGSYHGSRLFNNKNASSSEEELTDYLMEYFSDNMGGWDDVLNTQWDKREFIALNHRPFNNKGLKDLIDLSKPHFFVNTVDLYLNLENILPGLFEYLELEIDETRLEQWKDVYREWSKRRADIISWDENFHVIVDYIVNGHEMDLTRFNLDILREASILHELLYKHNLNIKGYGLEQLPRNTKEIHELLEPNFHILSEY